MAKVKVIFDLPDILNSHRAEEVVTDMLENALDEMTTERVKWRIAKPRSWNLVSPIEDK